MNALNGDELDAAKRDIEQLRAGLASRTDIGIAIGILMERYSIDRKAAFALLLDVSSTTNRKVRDISSDLAAGRIVSKFDGSETRNWILRRSGQIESAIGTAARPLDL